MTKIFSGFTVTCFFILLTMVISFRRPAGGMVHGNIIPVDGALHAFLFSGKDTLSVNIANGSFQFSNVAAGNYILLVESVPPYRNAVKDAVRVIEGELTDAGQIELLRQ